MLAKLLTTKVAAAVAVGTLSAVGVAAAATDNLPGGGARHSDTRSTQATTGAATGVAAQARAALCEAVAHRGGPAESGPAADALATLAGGRQKIAAYCAQAGSEPSSAADQGPDATGPAAHGLCQAYQAGQGGERGGKESAAAFEALARAAGGKDKIAAYCATLAATPASGSAASGRPSAVPTGHGPAATPSHPAAPVSTPTAPGAGHRRTP